MSFKIPNVVNRGSVRWILVAVFLVGTFGATGIAAAQLDGTENEFYNETTPITDDTTELETTIGVEVSGREVYVNYYRIADDSDSTETLESEGVILNSATGNETTASWPVQTNETTAYRAVVHDNGNGLSTDDVGNISVAALSSGGGGGFFTGSNGDYKPGSILLLVVVIGAIPIALGVD